MDDRLREFRAAVLKLGGPRRGRRYSPALRVLAVSYWVGARAQGRALRSAAGDLGVSQATLHRWAEKSESGEPVRQLQEVVLADPGPAAAGVSVVTPTGYRIEGLSLPEVASLLRSLP